MSAGRYKHCCLADAVSKLSYNWIKLHLGQQKEMVGPSSFAGAFAISFVVAEFVIKTLPFRYLAFPKRLVYKPPTCTLWSLSLSPLHHMSAPFIGDGNLLWEECQLMCLSSK